MIVDKKTLKDYEEEFEKLQEKYKDNELFDSLLDLLLAIDQIFEVLRIGKYEIIKKPRKVKKND